MTYERAGELIDQLKLDIADLERAAAADGEGEDDPQALPKEIARREALCDRLDAARRRLEARAKARAEAERADYEAKVAARETRTGRAKGKHPKPPDETPRADEQSNLSDPDSRLMRKRQHEYRQAYNAQADAGGSQLMGARVTNCAATAMSWWRTWAIPAVLGRPATVLAAAMPTGRLPRVGSPGVDRPSVRPRPRAVKEPRRLDSPARTAVDEQKHHELGCRLQLRKMLAMTGWPDRRSKSLHSPSLGDPPPFFSVPVDRRQRPKFRHTASAINRAMSFLSSFPSGRGFLPSLVFINLSPDVQCVK